MSKKYNLKYCVAGLRTTGISFINDRSVAEEEAKQRFLKGDIVGNEVGIFKLIGVVTFGPPVPPEAVIINLDDEDPKNHISSLNLSSRTYNTLTYAGVSYVSEIPQLSSRELLKLPNFGKASLIELKKALAERGFTIQK